MSTTLPIEQPQDYRFLFNTCIINPTKYPEIDAYVQKMNANQETYHAVSDVVNVPWYFISIIHCMEGSIKWLIALTIPILFVSCHVVLIGAYDQNVDESIQKISTEISTMIVKIEKNIDDNRTIDNKYENFRDSYIDIFGEIETLKIRTNSLPKYSKVTEQVILLDKNIHDFESLHKIGFNDKAVVETAKGLIEQSLQAMLSAQEALKRDKS
jgi:hypothetical protein